MGTTGVNDAAGATGRQDISGAVTSVTLRFVRNRSGEEGVARTLAMAGERRPAAVLEDPRSWSTHDEAISLLGAASQVTGDREIGRHVGEEILRQHDGTEVADLLRSLGSPAELLRNVTAAAAKFTTVASVEPLEVGSAHAVVRAHTRPGFERHPYLCELTKGLLSQVPVLFGLVPATVTESECQARGGRYCLYSVAWEARQWTAFVDQRASLYTVAWGDQSVVEARSELEVDPEARVTLLEEQLRQMGQRLEEVYTTASDLLSGDDISQLLATITRRAAGAVNAPRYLLVVRTEPNGPPHLHHHGFEEREARALAQELWRPEPDDAGGSRLIVDIASARQTYGRLAAVYPPGMRFMPRERELFSVYANYAATALDLVTSLSETRRSRDTASALLDFSKALARVGSTEEVCQTLADTVPAVAGCDRSAVLLWDPFEQKLVLRALSGGAPGAQPRWDGQGLEPPPGDGAGAGGQGPGGQDEAPFAIAASDTPVVASLMGSREILVLDPSLPDPYLNAIFEQTGTRTTVLAPLFSDDEFLGVVSADFMKAAASDPRRDDDLKERLRALGNHAVTALQNAWLLEQVGHLAWHDALTGLPNRRLLEDRVHQELERAQQLGDMTAIFFIDLDRFKRVNDNLGHAAGDELIRQVSQRLREVVRRQDTVARLGGDEFAVLLPGLGDLTAIRNLAGRMLDSLHEPYRIGADEVHTSASIGIAVHPEHGESYDELLSHADEAMYRSKGMGRNTFNVFVADVEAPESSRDGVAVLEADLRHAVDRDELFVLYQPYIDLQSNQVVGVEALVRWRHPTEGVLEPASFIPRAEETDVIVGIDEFVVRTVARQLRSWMDQGVPPLRGSVNVSGRDLLHEGFAESVMSALRSNDVPPELFELEITERVEVDDAGLMQQTVEKLQLQGVRFSIDDFGAGSSSLRQVAAFPVSTLKIDRSFVQILGPTDELNVLASGIIAMADRLGLDCVAEGVETSHQSRVLLQRGFTTAQGFFFSPPLPPEEVLHLLTPERDGEPPPGPAHQRGPVSPPAPWPPAPTR